MNKEEEQNKRKHVRHDLYISLKCWKLDQKNKPLNHGIESTAKDLSVGGVGFKSLEEYSIGSKLLMEIALPGRQDPINVHSKVVRIESEFGANEFIVGAAFEDIKPEDVNFIATSLESMNLYTLLDKTVKANASDLHLTVGSPPVMRIEGHIHFMETEKIQEGQIKTMIYPLLNQEQIEHFEKRKELDFAFSPDINSRFRVNLHYQRGFIEATLRSVTASTKSFEELGLPVEIMERFSRTRSGLILMAGKTGSGKSTTMTSMVDYINENLARVVITTEDPIEYIHTAKKSVVKQRELGSDTMSFADALKYCLRQDPDVVVVGELRDSESVINALRAAETGQLIISTVHAGDAVQALERLVNLFPPDMAHTIADRLSMCLIGILYQLLLPTKQGTRVLATELLVNTPAIKNLIREGAYAKIKNNMQTGATFGMYLLQSSLKKLLDKGLIDPKDVEEYIKAS